MSGGGHIIIRSAMKTALQDPMVHGLIPDEEVAAVDAILATDVNDWTIKETHLIAKVFHWVAIHS